MLTGLGAAEGLRLGEGHSHGHAFIWSWCRRRLRASQHDDLMRGAGLGRPTFVVRKRASRALDCVPRKESVYFLSGY